MSKLVQLVGWETGLASGNLANLYVKVGSVGGLVVFLRISVVVDCGKVGCLVCFYVWVKEL